MAEKDKMQKVPEGWKIDSIGNLCEILDSKRIPLSDEVRQYMKGDIPYYGANGLLDYINDYIFDIDLLLLAEDGGHFEEYQKKPIAYKVKGKSWVNNHAHVLSEKNETCLDFLFYNLAHRNITYYITGGTRGKLNQSALKVIPVIIPQSVTEQRAIAEILTTCDEAIEKTDAKIEKLKRIKQGLVQDLFHYGIDENGQIRSEKTHKFKDSPLGRIPVEWKIKTLQEVKAGKVQNGYFKKPELVGSGYRLINVYDLYQDFGIDLNLVERVEAKNNDVQKFKVQEGDCFFTRSSLVLDGIAHCNIILDLPEVALFECHVIKIRPNVAIIMPEYFAHWCRSACARKLLMQMAKQVTMASISQPDIVKLKIPLPKKDEQLRIIEILGKCQHAIRKEEIFKQKLTALKRGLMDDLLSGKVRVNKLIEKKIA